MQEAFANLPLPGGIGLFVLAAAVVWIAGTRLARYADAIAEQTGLGSEFIGILLLGGVTSLPELAVAITASLAGTPLLTVNDVLGSASINILIIALADAALGRDAITSVLGSPSLLLQGVLGILLFAVAAAATFAGDLPLLGIGVWSWLLAAGYIGSVWLIAKTHSARAWLPGPEVVANPANESSAGAGAPVLRPLLTKTAAAGGVILVAGFVLARTADAIAQQTAFGTSFFGAVFLAASTSLPEVSTVLAAVRLRRYEMAIADVFGTNLFNVTIIFVADALYRGEPVLSQAGPFAGFGALLAIVLTALFLAGMIERQNRTLFRMGMDSLVVIVCYVAGVVVLYQLR